ncbi:MAG: Transketolase protein [uncultured bacterium]|nr:MAG: Transketolase protein [uncultured bacterium]HBY74296.1 transketolase [Candidatus Kerfeldbacteria bacterium]
MSSADLNTLRLAATDIRIDLFKALAAAGSGHSAGPLGMADIFAALFLNVAKLKPTQPDWPERDRIVLSNGHICPVLYATMAHAGYFPREELMTLRKFGSRLQGHPHREALPGLETTSGPLGSGTSEAAGMALGFKMDQTNQRVWCLTSDGEQQEGNTWEGVMFAAAYHLDNLTVIMDRNYIQIDGNTEQIMPLDPLADKYQAFNWHVIEIDGNDMAAVITALKDSTQVKGKPTLILANVVPGKGVSFVENDYVWHGKPPSQDELAKGLAELTALREQLCQ